MAVKKTEVKPVEAKPAVIAPYQKQQELKDLLTKEEIVTIRQAFSIASAGFPPNGLKERMAEILQKLKS
jgi:hypothetical protein